MPLDEVIPGAARRAFSLARQNPVIIAVERRPALGGGRAEALGLGGGDERAEGLSSSPREIGQ